MTRDEALALMEKYKLKESLDAFPELQMHYDVEATADEIIAAA